MRTILNIRTMRYALCGVAALLFISTAIAAWLPQYYERQLHVAEGRGEGLFFLIVVLGGIPGVLLGGRLADKFAPKIQGGRLALPAIFLFVGSTCFTASFLVRADHYTLGAVGPVFVLQLIGLFIITLSIPSLRAGLTDAIPAHLRGAGFGAFNLVAVIFGQAAAPFLIGAISGYYDDNLRVAFLMVAPISVIGVGGAVPSPQVPRRGHAEDHDGGARGDAGRARPQGSRRRGRGRRIVILSLCLP